MFNIQTWNSICLQGRKFEPYFSLIINGKRIFSINEYPEKEFKSGKLNIFGTTLDSYVSGTFGAFTDFNVWNQSISIEDINNWIQNNASESMKDLSWKDVQLELQNLEEKEVIFIETSYNQNNKNIFMKFDGKTFQESKWLCKNLGGQIATPKSGNQMNILKESIKNGEIIWLSFTDERQEGNFQDFYTGEKLFDFSLEPFIVTKNRKKSSLQRFLELCIEQLSPMLS